jgi:hypothetical protein
VDRGLERNDAASAGAVLDPDFEWTDSDGRTRTRVEALQNLQALAGDLRGESDPQRYHYGHVHVVTSGRPGARMMRVWTLRREGWRALAVISTALSSGATPFAARGAAIGDCDNPCRTMPYTPTTENEKQIAAIFQRLKVDEWHPDPVDLQPACLGLPGRPLAARQHPADRDLPMRRPPRHADSGPYVRRGVPWSTRRPVAS